jgi:hypothetical protein
LTLIALALALSLAPSEPAERSKEQTITVTGVRDGATVLVIDFERVWRNCAECKRALNELDKRAEPYRAAKRELSREETAARQSVRQIARAPAPSHNASWRRSSEFDTYFKAGVLHAALQQHRFYEAVATHSEIARQRVTVPARSQAEVDIRVFLDQLVPLVEAAAEEERIERGAALVIEKKRKLPGSPKVERVDVTNAVIARLDSVPFTIRFPEKGNE